MSPTIEQPLIFWSFFERIEKELSYERWIDKYRLFRQLFSSGAIPYDEDWRAFRQCCKFLYLQDHSDEARFDELLDQAIAEEKARLIALWRQAEATADAPSDPDASEAPAEQSPPSAPPDTSRPPLSTATPPPPKPQPQPATETKYFHPGFEPPAAGSDATTALHSSNRYLHTDEYFPANRRELVKSWQYLRRMERSGASDRIDIPQTVRKIAKTGVLTAPEYINAYVNRQDVLFLFADSRGSMTPFHELSRRLIETAKGEGGHRRAPTYYFQNAPLEYLFQAPNLTMPVALKGAVQKANRNISYAFVISDAGAARGNKNSAQIERRLRLIRPFLDLLQAHMAHVIWLNPMPQHRWAGTAAEAIAQEPGLTAMVPVLEEGAFNYQDVIRRIIKYKFYG